MRRASLWILSISLLTLPGLGRAAESNGSTVSKEIATTDLPAHAGLARTILNMRRAVRGYVSDRDLKFEVVRSIHKGTGELVGYQLKVSTPRSVHFLELERDGSPGADWSIDRFASNVKGDRK